MKLFHYRDRGYTRLLHPGNIYKFHGDKMAASGQKVSQTLFSLRLHPE